jgi:hypothetical protein
MEGKHKSQFCDNHALHVMNFNKNGCSKVRSLSR